MKIFEKKEGYKYYNNETITDCIKCSDNDNTEWKLITEEEANELMKDDEEFIINLINE